MAAFALLLMVLLANSHAERGTVSLWRNHSKRLRMSVVCSELPQERVVTLEELQIPRDNSQSVNPVATVLHRCEPYILCCPGQKRSAVATETVQLTFAFEDKVNKKRTYQSFPAANHTLCGCVS